MGSGVTQHTQGIERGNGFLGLWGIVYALGFVDDDDGMGILDKAHGCFAAQPVLGLIDDIFRLLESIDVYNHHFDVGASGELPHIRQLCGVVDKVPARHIVILQVKMLPGGLK